MSKATKLELIESHAGALKIREVTAAEFEEHMKSTHCAQPRSFDVIPGQTAYILDCQYVDRDNDAVLCSWRGEWVSWLRNRADGSCYWGAYGSQAEPKHLKRTGQIKR